MDKDFIQTTYGELRLAFEAMLNEFKKVGAAEVAGMKKTKNPLEVEFRNGFYAGLLKGESLVKKHFGDIIRNPKR